MKILSSYTHPHVVPKPHDLLSFCGTEKNAVLFFYYLLAYIIIIIIIILNWLFYIFSLL